MDYEPLTLTHPVVVMGVSGCGKSTVGERLAEIAGISFVEGDALHPAGNIEKMSKGVPLTDEDRLPWLERIGADIKASMDCGQAIIVSCSSLKRSYRDTLRTAAGGKLAFVFLEGTRDLLLSRMGARQGHFMPVSLLDNQLQVLEVPTGEAGVVTVNIDNPIETIVLLARNGLEYLEKHGETHAG